MTIIGIAHVPGTTTLAREDTLRLPAPAEQHPTWCAEYGSTTQLVCGGNHLGESVDVVATAGGFVVVDSGALVPRFSIAPATQDGAPAVSIALFDPTAGEFEWVEANLSPVTARELAAALETGQAAQSAGINHGAAWLAVRADEPVTVDAIDRTRKVLVSARLHAHEATALAAAITRAADVVEQVA